MEPFTHGILFMETFPSLAGDIEILAAVRFEGKTVCLTDISVAPAAAGAENAGYRVLRGIMEQITGAAYAQGFEAVEFEGERLTGVSIGRIARVARRKR